MDRFHALTNAIAGQFGIHRSETRSVSIYRLDFLRAFYNAMQLAIKFKQLMAFRPVNFLIKPWGIPEEAAREYY